MTGTQDYLLRLSRGLIPGATGAVLVGKNNDIDTGTTPETVWWAGGQYVWPTSTFSLEVVSTSALDTAAGTGARTLLLQVMDANYVESVVAVSLNGVTPVAVTGTWFRLQMGRVDTAGSTDENQGDITIRIAGAGATQATIPVGRGRTQAAVYTIPAGKTAFFLESTISFLRATGTESAEVQFRTREPGKSWLERGSFGINASSSFILVPQRVAAPVAEKSDVEIRVFNATGSNTAVGVTATLLLFSNTQACL